MLEAGFADVSRKWVCTYLIHALPWFADDEYCNPNIKKESQILLLGHNGRTRFLVLYRQDFNES
jgi:hypothetical protein